MTTKQVHLPQAELPQTNGKSSRSKQYSRRIQELVTQAKAISTTLEMQRLLVEIQLCAEAIEGNTRAMELLESGSPAWQA